MFRKYCSTLPAPHLHQSHCKPSCWHQPPLAPPQIWLLLSCSHPTVRGCCPNGISSTPAEIKCSVPLRCCPNTQERRSSQTQSLWRSNFFFCIFSWEYHQPHQPTAPGLLLYLPDTLVTVTVTGLFHILFENNVNCSKNSFTPSSKFKHLIVPV